MLHETLKQATAHAHDHLEQLMFVDKIMNGSLTLNDYKKILLTNYIVHYWFEDQVFKNLDQNLKQELSISQREKLPALIKDILELNMDLPEVDCSQQSLQLNGNATALGAMYVMEGATLGGNVIVKKLKVNPELQQYQLGFHYYQAYGSDLITRWKQFCAVLNSKVSESEYSASVEAALFLFNQFAIAQNKTVLKEA